MKGANDLTKPRFLLPIPRKALNSLTLACLIFFHYCNSNILMFPLRGFYRITSYISSSSLTTSEHSLRAYLRGCFPGLSPQQVCWIKHTFQLWGCAFFSSTTLHHQGNANQNQKLRYHLTPVRTVIIKRWLVLERMRRKENPLVLFVPCWWPSHCGKQSGDSTKKKQNHRVIQQSHFLIFIQRKRKPNIREISVLPSDCSFTRNSRDMETTCVHQWWVWIKMQ